MKNIAIVLTLLMFTLSAQAQKEKLKGSKVVTSQEREIGDFDTIEIEDNVELFLTKGDKCELEIDADDNLHDAISITSEGSILRISTTGEVSSFKKLSVKVTYTDNLKLIVAKDDVRVTALDDMQLGDFTLKASGNTKIYATLKAKSFTLMGNDKAKAEMNITAENATIELSKNSQLKALISAPAMKFDMYQKGAATIEGDVNEMKLRMDNNSDFTGRNLTAKNAEIVTEGSSQASLAVTDNAIVEASGKSSIDLHGDQKKIEIRKFTDAASIRKRPLKS